MSPFRQHRPLGPGRLAVLLTLGPLAGCARAPIDLDLSPSRGPTLRTAIGPLTVSGTLGREGLGVGLRSGPPVTDAGRRNWPHTVASASAAQVLATADQYVGTRYRYGGESPAAGFDCSGFVQYVYGR